MSGPADRSTSRSCFVVEHVRYLNLDLITQPRTASAVQESLHDGIISEIRMQFATLHQNQASGKTLKITVSERSIGNPTTE